MYSEFEDFVAFLFSREEMSVKIYTFENCVFDGFKLERFRCDKKNNRDTITVRFIINNQYIDTRVILG